MTEHDIDIMLEGLRLTAMAESYKEIVRSRMVSDMTTPEVIAQMCLAQKEANKHKTLIRLKRAAKFKFDAQPEDINWDASRGLDKSKLRSLTLPDWVNRTENVMLTGASGTGKTWLACAIGQSVIRHGVTVRYARTNLILEDMRAAHLDGTIARLRKAFIKPKLLIIDDFGIAPISEPEKEDLFELLEARTDVGSTLIAGQLAPGEWYQYLSSGHLADAIMDRVVQRSHSIELKGKSLRARF
ncbi:MAG: IS21-like element helper ATPase IstB [Maricaulaceae bacterium]